MRHRDHHQMTDDSSNPPIQLNAAAGPARGRSTSGRDKILQQQAIAWLSLLSSGNATVADGEALKQWCRQDEANARAYADAARLWQMLTPLAAGMSAPALPIAGSARTPAIGRRALIGGAMAAAAVGVTYTALHPPFGLWPSMAELAADIRTGTGERRRVDIARGIAVDLNTRTSLRLGHLSGRLEGKSTEVELVAGEAEVAAELHAEDACMVVAGGIRTTVQNARIDVRIDEDGRVRMLCLNGAVELPHPIRVVTLSKGLQATYDARSVTTAEAADPATVMAWQQGRLVFRRTPLSLLIAEVNRYRPGRLVLLDAALGQRVIDATFQIGHLDNVLVYLQQAFDARVRRLPAGIVLIG